MLTRTPLLSRCFIAALASLALLGSARADLLSAPAAEAALGDGALAWDLRAQAAAGLPGARRIEAAELERWLQRGDLAALEAAVSRAGLDLSRDIVIYGEPGDLRAQALLASLQPLARGRLHWLVGGASEWAMSGRALSTASGVRHPVPQRLVASNGRGAGVMAGAAWRSSATEELLAAR
ncbi:rhodanese-like domain-containing protein [Roseateles violae]|uniref:Rhodanese-like domain-containing protein n=1 Tax=Roseateles violae TaxID=3058042 RepID=A0ABT8DY77_9BURK|nr:rhodanese-like domain-containing protein [Pelomonas sp. PFR6]MDN3922199.1 rhodanese-like domain-containing protein [Pelomonas sp. PFR6]